MEDVNFLKNVVNKCGYPMRILCPMEHLICHYSKECGHTYISVIVLVLIESNVFKIP